MKIGGSYLVTDRFTSWPDKRPTWFALFPLGEPGNAEVRRVTIERVHFWKDDYAFYYVTKGVDRVGMFPDTSSDEWIEYIPEPLEVRLQSARLLPPEIRCPNRGTIYQTHCSCPDCYF